MSTLPPREFSNPRFIRPAGGGDQRRNESPTAAKKRKITAVACRSCQRKRCKCDGGRPRCSACVASGATTECMYDTRSDQSRLDALKEKNTELQEQNHQLRALLESARGPEGGQNAGSSSSNMPDPSFFRVAPKLDPPRNSNSPSSLAFDSDSHNTTTYEESRANSREQAQEPTPSSFASPGLTQAPSDAIESLQTKVVQLEWELGRLRSAVMNMQSQEGSSNTQDHQPIKEASRPRAAQRSQTEWQPFTGQNDRSRPHRRALTGDDDEYSADQHPIIEQFAAPTAHPYVHRPQAYGGFLDVYGNLPMSSAILANFHASSIQSAQISSLRLPLHLIQMLNWEDHVGTSHSVLTPEFASSTFSSFRAFGRGLIANGADPELVLGPESIDVEQFFHADHTMQTHTTSTFAPWFLGAYPSMTITARVACAIMMQRLLRWQISPTSEHFDLLPEWFRATGSQMFIPHLSAFDFLPWPMIRQLLIDERLPSRQVLVMIMSNLAIDWPNSTEDIFTWNYETGEATGINPAFTAHIVDLNNWAINSKILPNYPYLDGKARFMDLNHELEQGAATATDHVPGLGDV